MNNKIKYGLIFWITNSYKHEVRLFNGYETIVTLPYFAWNLYCFEHEKVLFKLIVNPCNYSAVIKSDYFKKTIKDKNLATVKEMDIICRKFGKPPFYDEVIDKIQTGYFLFKSQKIEDFKVLCANLIKEWDFFIRSLELT